MPLPVTIFLDPELRVMHAQWDCPASKVARKYNYLEKRKVVTAAEARKLDKEYRSCERCEKLLTSARGPAGPARSFRYRRRRQAP